MDPSQLELYARHFSMEDIQHAYRRRSLKEHQGTLPLEKKLLFTLIFLISLLLLAEGIAHYTLCSPSSLENPLQKKNSLFPQSSTEVFSGETYTLNAKNCRGKLPSSTISSVSPVPKQILCLGDAFTFGTGVKEEETFSAVLQEKSTGEWEVWNGASPGFSLKPESWTRFFLLIESIQPNLILFCPGPEVLVQLSRQLHLRDLPPHSVLHHSALIQSLFVLKRKWRSFQGTEGNYALKQLQQRPSKKFHPKVFEPFKEKLSELVALCRKKHIPLLLLTTPHLFDEKLASPYPLQKMENLYRFSEWSLENWKDLNQQWNQLLSLFQQEGVFVIQIPPEEEKLAYFQDTHYFNTTGHHFLAQFLYSLLKEKFFPPPAKGENR